MRKTILIIMATFLVIVISLFSIDPTYGSSEKSIGKDEVNQEANKISKDELEIDVEDESVTIQIWRSKYQQAVAGVNYTSLKGFVFMVTGGYAFLLRENVNYVSGSESALDQVKPTLHAGISLAFTLGYAF